MEHGTAWLQSSLIYLGAAVLAVPLARLLGLGSIIGYLAAGIAIGPWGLAFVSDPAAILEFAEFGVVLMLFLVGLELEPRRLWALRRPIFGSGSVQLLGSAALITAAALLAGVEWRTALVAGLGLGLSSTAIGLAVLNERNLMATTAGQSVLSVALLQDIAAIPIVKLSGRQQRDALDSERTMGRRPCARWPGRRAVGVPLERRVRPQPCGASEGACDSTVRRVLAAMAQGLARDSSGRSRRRRQGATWPSSVETRGFDLR